MTHCAKFAVSFYLLKELLHLPDDATIIDAFLGYDEQSVDFVVEHPDLPDAADFQEIKRCRPVWRRQPEAVLVDWRIDR